MPASIDVINEKVKKESGFIREIVNEMEERQRRETIELKTSFPTNLFHHGST